MASEQPLPQIPGLTIQCLLGRGRNSAVYRAQQAVSDRIVALKILDEDVPGDTQLQRLQHEARLIASLDHPNIAKIWQFGVSLEGKPYILMEYIKGQTLASRLVHGCLTVAEFEACFLPLCDALQAVHAMDMVHRDLPPGNIMLVQSDTSPAAASSPRLIDFGIAQWCSGSQQSMPDNTTGVLREHRHT